MMCTKFETNLIKNKQMHKLGKTLKNRSKIWAEMTF